MQLKQLMENFKIHLEARSIQEAAKGVADLKKSGYKIEFSRPNMGYMFLLKNSENQRIGFIEFIPIEDVGLSISHEEHSMLEQSPFFQKLFQKFYDENAALYAEEWGYDLSDPEVAEHIKDEMYEDFWEEDFMDYMEKIDCMDAWSIGRVHVSEDGWGPLLYDLAIEYATLKGGGLTPGDKVGTVSNEAFAVWEFYMKNRPDVKKVQLDDLFNTLTPDPKDNCAQGGSIGSMAKGRPKFPDSPLNFIYRKEPVLLKQLGLI